ncbi:3-methyl-2-oxobutanoate hydroxymethyltransferase [Rhodoblastus acidophilus]|uniref:3-methyl-2-oxobutanoate hydroxymethyltransferase n=1 Tax=Candidatus Rhodoblastus alkanivorans TaxID=2954117 RepID=A0ABS9ZAC1_9HYPH|nr:3-methyl-2-oxobutanoate hydroxymethyltransferase [Candidatus Rhodoblastus alkanivorans]MCI4677861.1 3-methyl-2-oxobutanoate hydroxymethyltransferase [Candidatus Rhodoblastus alkanivorans]MCI4684640.1 3-methyl-2-oxobutanoate hydroxymethyltransferase [Candidatus Rhodoblastus alkanivorans]MDI4641962.1 3-methyl-2-oxobutanoate hydroxymethyltransferase [Rhodoblastus acidophilus]
MRSLNRFAEMKRNGEKIAMLTAYDAPQARAQQEAGIDAILVGDSVGVNILGYASEREVTLADMAHHTRAVRRGAPDAFILSDMPFATYDRPEQALASAKFLQQAGADAVKFEGAYPELVHVLGTAGIPVCGHLGFEPQHCEKRVHGKTFEEAAKILSDAKALDDAGAFMLVLELVPAELAAAVTRAIRAATIGIGAGPATDGQVLVFPDVLGYAEKNFRHNRRYAEVGATMRKSASVYLQDVRASHFPTLANCSTMPAEAFAQFEAEILEKQG